MDYINDISMENFPNYEAEMNEKFNEGKIFMFLDFLKEDVCNEDGIIE